jgi:hypothetical protein
MERSVVALGARNDLINLQRDPPNGGEVPCKGLTAFFSFVLLRFSRFNTPQFCRG